ncbi:cysteine dioxygenase family protein [Bacillus sp. DTU_2020_1000418_1_SI_GHA_SEK_038]|uniref:cysteine dioxygenase n=1 Tax=Bacillus sp. DTU_2020_1000418_1_SI_GHA_SEK_038 TaxID=3077585 RepID=UPI0028F0B449|nr:cysteine dioxygenase family protein [Bacillus sp. DTU_2020_1000418_1_SI_GHA_SEK_038]WNS76905.1 cysteine dioxygenase family protein [Bacillus sp. DTU_2020_1000418_1_SI_GHA_SEK_038]
MPLTTKAKKILDSLKSPTKEELRDALLQLDMSLAHFSSLPEPADQFPYNRRLLYKSEEVELLVMNWSQLECAPHDHGQSQGWIQVLSGTSLNSVYELDENGLPSEWFHEYHHEGKCYYAPKRGIHKMKASNQTHLVTIHLYSPPITNMIVYDLEKCASCIVSDDCGAWWPKEQYQKVKELKLKRDNVM